MLKILIADDHELIRRGVRGVVESHAGWEVCGEANDGNEALEQAFKHHPDVIVLDVSLPGMNGLGVTRRLHQDHAEHQRAALHDARRGRHDQRRPGRRGARLPA
jgi:DNA-binding NarL/FixJ family response regulator